MHRAVLIILPLVACADTPTVMYRFDGDAQCWDYVTIDLPREYWRGSQPGFDEECGDGMEMFLGADGTCYLFDCVLHLGPAVIDPFFGPPCDDAATCCPTAEAAWCMQPLNGSPTEVELP